MKSLIHFLKRYLHHLWIALLWTLIILILLTLPGSMLPKEQTFQVPNFDKLVHMSLFGGFMLLWAMYYNRKELIQKKLLVIFFRIFIIASLYGTATEFIQKYFIPSREFEIGDILADVVGAAIAYGIANIYLSAEE
jgi:VanZ family protein